MGRTLPVRLPGAAAHSYGNLRSVPRVRSRLQWRGLRRLRYPLYRLTAYGRESDASEVVAVTP